MLLSILIRGGRVEDPCGIRVLQIRSHVGRTTAWYLVEQKVGVFIAFYGWCVPLVSRQSTCAFGVRTLRRAGQFGRERLVVTRHGCLNPTATPPLRSHRPDADDDLHPCRFPAPCR